MHGQQSTALSSVSTQPPVERRSLFRRASLVLYAALVPGAARAAQSNARPKIDELNALREQVRQMSNQLGILEDTHAIRKLHHAYGYYLDKCMYQEVVKLFAEDGEVYFNGGIFVGRDKGVRRLYIDAFQQTFTKGKNGPVHGFLLDHLQMQDIVDVATDRKTAQARFRCFMQAGSHESSKAPLAESARKQGRQPAQWWEGGIYENRYVRENGIWKIRLLNYRAVWHADFETGWAHTRPNYVSPFSSTFPENPTGPDRLIEPPPVLWPDTAVVPFHYPHPVTG
jgi:hypothetical protein